MNVGADMFGMVKTNTKVLCKDTIYKITKYCPGGSYLLLKRKCVVPRDRFLISIGYKYNARQFLSFIDTKEAGRTKPGIPCLSD